MRHAYYSFRKHFPWVLMTYKFPAQWKGNRQRASASDGGNSTNTKPATSRLKSNQPQTVNENISSYLPEIRIESFAHDSGRALVRAEYDGPTVKERRQFFNTGIASAHIQMTL
jgi:hypothetical protein